METNETPQGSGETPAEEGRKRAEAAAAAEPTPPTQTPPEPPDAPEVTAEASDSEPAPPPAPLPARTRPGFLEELAEEPVAVPSRVPARQSRRDFVLVGPGASAAAAGAWWRLPSEPRSLAR